MKNEIVYIPIEKIHPHPDNPRKNIGDITELTESVKMDGVMQNLTVVPNKDIDGEYTLVIGHRRCAAAKAAGLTELPCIISDMDYKKQVSTMLVENIQRSDLTVIEQADGFQMMIDLGDSIEDVVEKTAREVLEHSQKYFSGNSSLVYVPQNRNRSYKSTYGVKHSAFNAFIR